MPDRILPPALAAGLALLFLVLVAQPATAGGTPDPGTAIALLSTAEDQLLSITGEGDVTANGDYVSALTGLNQPYDLFIEVPPGQTRLQVDLFDADVGGGGGGEFFDTQVGGTWNTRVVYQLIQPDGTVFSTGAATTCGVCDNAWLSPGLFNVANPQPGHWRFRVDQAIFTGTNGNDENAFGVRAHDGDATAGGTEYAVYAESFVGLGERAPAGTAVNREYDLFPYVTRGCSMSIRDFDADGAGAWTLDTRAGASLATGPASLSGNDAWNTNTYAGWTSDLDASDYGLFHFFFQGVALAGGSNNVYTVYLGNDIAAGTPPTAQPEAETLRLYLPADGSTWSGNGTVNSGAGTILRPLQPYVGHTWTPIVNAPVRIGATTRVRVSVTVTNPTAQAVQFDSLTSGSRVLIATVPTNGGPTALVGGSASGPGAVAEAGAGPWTVTWAPGVIAAGATATLTYDLDVTPTAAGTLQFTGDPAGVLGAGTIATYLDGTCANAGGGASVCLNAAQLAGATFTFGPLCELEADVQLPTPAVIAALWASDRADSRVVGWQSAAEVGVSTYQLHRVEDGVWQPIAGASVPARPDAPEGGRYEVIDRSPVAPLSDSLYGLTAEDVDGTVRRHGPFQPTIEPPPTAIAPAVARASVAVPPKRLPSAHRVELPVHESGWHRADASDLAAAFGQSVDRVERWIGEYRMTLERRGLPVAWRAVQRAGGWGVEWYGEGPEGHPFVAESVYVLTRGVGVEVADTTPSTTDSGVFADGFEPASTCGWSRVVGALLPTSCASIDRRRLDHEEDRHAVVLLPLDPEGDVWFQHLLFAGHATLGHADLGVDLGSAVGDTDARLTLRLQGGSSHVHEVRVTVAGETIGRITIDGLAAADAVLAVPARHWAAGRLDLRVEVEDGGWVFVDGMALEYARLAIAESGVLALEADATGPLTVEGLGGGARVVDLGDPRTPRLVATAVAASSSGSGLRFEAVAGRRYLAFDDTGVRRVAPRADPTHDVREQGAGTEYLIIADSPLVDAAGALAALRSADGWTTRVVDVDDIFDTYAGGDADPRTIRQFLTDLAAGGSPPRFVALVGAGTYDYRDRRGFRAMAGEGGLSPLLVPSHVDTPSLFPSDGAFVDVGGPDARRGDGAPEMAVGRIPVRTADELSTYVEALRRHQLAGDMAGRRLLVLSDRDDAVIDFASEIGTLTSGLGRADRPGAIERLVLDARDTEALAADRELLFARLADDTGIVTYLGHGGLDRLASPGWLTAADLGRLEPDVPPVFLALTCHVGLHGLPGYDALGEQLVRDGAAIAFWGPAWLSSHGAALEIGRDALRRLAETPTPTLGEAVRAALQAAADRGVPADQLLTFQLIGDPAVVPRLAPFDRPLGSGSES